MKTNPQNHPAKNVLNPVMFGAVILLMLLMSLQTASARRNIRTGFFDAFPSAVGTRLDTLPSNGDHCGVCHYDFEGGGQRNPFGIRLGNIINDFPKSDAGRRDAVLSIQNEDSDEDGVSTLDEVTDTVTYANTPTFPGLTPGNYSTSQNVDLSEIINHLIPSEGGDTTPPDVTILIPDGGETFVGNTATNIEWTATDAGSGVASISIYLSLDDGATFSPLALGIANTGVYSWVPANRPSTLAIIQITAVDRELNSYTEESEDPFTIVSPPGGRVPTTLRDFDMPGTQPLEGTLVLEDPTTCNACHGNYDENVEPFLNWEGSPMAHASRDPLFEANMVIANQDAPDSGDLCLRCHLPRGWLQGRSIPTDGASMVAEDFSGVACDLCHRLVDPIPNPGINPPQDTDIIASLLMPPTHAGNGMMIVDPSAVRRGPFTDPASPHSFLVSPFHQEAALCGTCHDVSNPAFQKNVDGDYVPNDMDTPVDNTSPHSMLPVERTYSEWLHSDYNSPNGVYAPEFAGNKADGMVATCQDCHMRDVSGQGCNPAIFPTVPTREDMPLHDMTGGSTWLPGLLPGLYPEVIDAATEAALQRGIERATYMLQNAAELSTSLEGDQIKVTVVNNTGHKLPTGYPEGRRMWINVKFYDQSGTLLDESGAYDTATGVLSHDPGDKIYEVKPGLSAGLADALELPEGPSFHFVLNDTVYKDNRIPPRGFTNDVYALFGGEPVAHSYADGQYWDDTYYTLPEGATRAEVRLYYQSTSKEFVEFLRDENNTNQKGQEMYDLWNDNDKCPPTMMAESGWSRPIFLVDNIELTPGGTLQMEFLSQPGVTYTIEYSDELGPGATWQTFQSNGSITATNTTSMFEDDFTSNTSGGPAPNGTRFYRFRYPTN